MIENPKNCYHYDHCLFADTTLCVVCKNHNNFVLTYGLACDDCMFRENHRHCEQQYGCNSFSSMFQRELNIGKECEDCKFKDVSRTREPCKECVEGSNKQTDKIPFILCRKSGGMLMDSKECNHCPFNDSIMSKPHEANRGYCICGRYMYKSDMP